MFKALILSSFFLNLGLLLGRLSGFVREAFVASTYGVSAQADILVLMLTVPDVLVNILIGGALGAVFVPEFAQRPELARKLLFQSVLFFGLVFFCLAAGFYWQPQVLVAVMAPGLTAVHVGNAAVALSWVVWLVPLTVLTGIVTAFLQAQNKFAIAAMGTLIINMSIITGLVLVYFGFGSLQMVAVFVLLGGLLRLLSQVIQVKPLWNWRGSLYPVLLNRELFVRYGQAMVSGSVLLFFPVVARALASYESEGSIALFNYATRLIELPLAIAVTFLAIVLFPRLSKSFGDNSHLHCKLISYGSQITLALSSVAAVVLYVLSSAYTDTVYGHGDMPNTGLLYVAELTAIGMIMLPLQGLSGYLTTVFNARKDTRTPMLLNGAGLIFYLLATRSGLFGQGLMSLMWGMIASYGLICVAQLIFMKIENFSWRGVIFDKMFAFGLTSAVCLSYYLCQIIMEAQFSGLASMMLGCMVALVSLITMALFNVDVRAMLKNRLNVK